MATDNTEQTAPKSSYRFETLVVHVGSEPDPVTGAVCVPISLASTFAQPSPGVPPGRDYINSLGKGFEYSRTGNPTRGAFERCVAASENASYGIAFSSGSAATSAIIHMLKSGDHVVCVDDVYGGTQRYFRRIALPSSNIQFTFVDFNDTEKFEAAFTPATKMIWLETPTNPTLKISDIARTAEFAKQRGCLFCVDNTFMSPYFQNPLNLGADIVVHSVTKYIGGHSDVVMGVAATNDENIYNQLKFIQNGIGSVPSPFDCYLALRGIKTLHLRMTASSSNAQTIAEFLESHPKIDRVIYPGLVSHPQHELARRQQKGFGAMITFYTKGNAEHAKKFIESLRVFTLAESLGAVESLVESPALMTHASVPAEKRAELGISDSLIRLSVGIENVDDLLNDLRSALDEMGNIV